MNKRVLFILLGGLLILVLIVVLWLWFFGRHDKSDVLPGGEFGTASSTDVGSSGSGIGGNGEAPFGSNAGSNQNGGSNGSGNGSSGSIGSGSIDTSATDSYTSGSVTYVTPTNATWFDGSDYTYLYTTGSTTVTGGTSTRPSNFSFTQSPINSVNNSTINGTPRIQDTLVGADGTDISLLSSLAALVGGCFLQYGLEQLVIAPTIAASDAVTDSALIALSSFISIFSGPTFVKTSDTTEHTHTATDAIGGCITRSLGRLAVQSITQSTVDWINSGFDGQPAYVQDFNKFFSDVADQAAGDFLQSSSLAFLCSPFQLQVKIAVAQSYANRRANTANSCTLSGAIKNVDNFFAGNFSDGGWPGFLEITTNPSNNPFGANVQAQIALTNAQGQAIAGAKAKISPGGFLSQEKCDDEVHKTGCKIVTPGSTIEASLVASFGADVQSLQLGDSIDQILGALSNALITRVLQNTLQNVNDTSVTTSPNTANARANTLMNNLKSLVSFTQQYAGIKQRAIADIQSAQRNLTTLADCWTQATSSPSLSSDKLAQAKAGYTQALALLANLQGQVTALNNQITSANSTIAKIQELQTDLLLAKSESDLTAVEAQVNALASSGVRLYTTVDVTTATQDRQTLQGALTTLNTQTSAQLQQCYDLG